MQALETTYVNVMDLKLETLQEHIGVNVFGTLHWS
jgi:hypothetical protein